MGFQTAKQTNKIIIYTNLINLNLNSINKCKFNKSDKIDYNNKLIKKNKQLFSYYYYDLFFFFSILNIF